MQHHPVFSRFPRWQGEVPHGFNVDFLGVRTRLAFVERMPGTQPRPTQIRGEPPLPGFNEEYFEWIDVLEAALEARGGFTMVELGAGYGRWLVRAVAALRAANPLPFHLVAVEPEPTHFAWLREHLRDNGIDPGEHELIEAAVTHHGRRVAFHIGNAAGWYGQAVSAPDPQAGIRARLAGLRERMLAGLRRRDLAPEETAVVRLPSVTLQGILEPLERVDLIDLDVQGAEADVLVHAIDLLDARVRRVHVGTHGQEIEEELRRVFGERGWECRNDYPCLKSSASPYGEIEFNDGVQTWLNPRLA